MFRLDVEDKIIGTTVVQHYSNIVGQYDCRGLAISNDFSENLFEQWESQKIFSSKFFNRGYDGLLPVCDVEVIRNRQKIIQAFKEDICEGELDQHFNMMHLINEWPSLYTRQPDRMSLLTASKVLERYYFEGQKLFDKIECKSQIFEELKEDFVERFDHNSLKDIIAVCKKGGFDNIMISTKDGAWSFQGITGKIPNRDSDGVRYQGKHCFKEITGWSNYDVTKKVFYLGLSMLNDYFAKLGVLQLEANYMRRREQQGKRVCLGEIAESVFEMIEGEPILETPEPVEYRSFRFDRSTSKNILNGLHSGGKTHLLCDIAQYILRTQRGLSVPAKKFVNPLTRRIFHSLNINKEGSGGTLESEMRARLRCLHDTRLGDIHLIDEFLQHASPDAAEPLEPVILKEYENNEATYIIVDHRGETISENIWNFWSPTYRNDDGRIIPTYKFRKQKPSEEVLKLHARQLLEKIVKDIDKEENESEPDDKGVVGGRFKFEWLEDVEKRIVGGDY